MNTLIKNNEEQQDDPFAEYNVVKSIYQQYSIWPTVRDIPSGWESIGVKGSRSVCLSWIENNWEGPSL